MEFTIIARILKLLTWNQKYWNKFEIQNFNFLDELEDSDHFNEKVTSVMTNYLWEIGYV